jgi:predicted transcriptional regulator
MMKRSLKEIEYTQEVLELSRFAKALGHPVRLKILKFLADQSCCFTGELVDVLPLAQSTVSQHLKELRDAGLIRGEINPPRVRYCIHEKNWEKAQGLFTKFFQRDFLFSDDLRQISTK